MFYQRDKLAQADRSGFESEALKRRFERYGAVTLHRPSNVDERNALADIAGALRDIAGRLPLVLPVHPRTRGNLEEFGLDVILTKPLSYMDFLNLWKDARVRVTSGTSQRTTTPHRGEFSILRDCNPAAYAAAGLSYDPKFDLRQTLDLPFSTEWFSVPPAAPHGQTPKLGVLHPSLVRAVEAAFRAAPR